MRWPSPVDALVVAALNARGDLEVLRALARAERSTGTVFPVL